MNLNKQIIIITGGAGFLGSFFSDLICSYGGIPIIIDKDKIKAKKLSKKLSKKYSKRIIYYDIDITKEDDVKNSKKDILKNFKKIDSLVNNAALNPTADSLNLSNFALENYSMELFQTEFDVGLKGALICTKIFGQYFSTAKKGNIINISSDLGLIAPNQSIYNSGKNKTNVKPVSYSIIKSGLIGLTKYTSTYWSDKNIRCNAIAPGGVLNNQNKEFINKVSKLIPLGRLADKIEVGNMLIFLLSNLSSYINGTTISVDGGRTAW